MPGPSRAQAWAQAGPSRAQAWAQAGPKPGPSWEPKKSKKTKFSKSKSVLPKMSGRSGLVGQNPPGPIPGPLGPFFAWAGKVQKMLLFFVSLGVAPLLRIHCLGCKKHLLMRDGFATHV